MEKTDSHCCCARCGHTKREHDEMGEVAEKLHYRHAHELGPRLAECLDSGGFVAEEDSETHYVSMAALQW